MNMNSMLSEPVSADEEMSFDPRELLRIFWRRWKLIAGIMAVGLGLTLVYLLSATPLYTATTDILLDLRQDKTIDAEAVLSGLSNDAAMLESEIKLIGSESVGLRVINKLKLYNDPEFSGKGGKSLIATIGTYIPQLLQRGEATAEASSATPGGNAEPSGEELDRLSQAFISRVQVNRMGRTYIVSVSFTSSNPGKAARVANEVADAYLVDQLEATYQATRRANTWLRERLDELQAKVRDAERAVELYRAQNNLVAAKEETPFDSQIKKLNEEIILARVQMNEKQDQLKQAAQILEANGKLSTLDVVAKSDVVSKLRGQLVTVAQEEAELITRFTPAHPKVINKRAERQDLERQIENQAKLIVDNVESDRRSAQLRVASLEQSLNDINQQSSGARSASITLRELEREAAANRTIYEAFLGRYKETSQQEKLKTANSRVIRKALPPFFASFPKKSNNLMMALIGFAALGFGLAYLLEKMDNSFKTTKQIEDVLGIAPLASIPKLNPADLTIDGKAVPSHRFILAKPLSMYAEAIRTLKVGIELSNIDNPPQVILVTSAMPHEGKTTLTSSLAQHMAQIGARVLLIDCDLRNPTLTGAWISEPGPGLIDVLGQRASREQAIVRDASGVDFLQTAHVAQNSAEILGSASFKKLIKELRQHYNYIIIDSSPVMPVIDARVLVDSVDTIVLSVLWDQTPRELVRDALRSLNAPAEKLAGAVLNNMDMKRMSHYGSYGYGKYYSKYPHYYGASRS